MNVSPFRVIARDGGSRARCGELSTRAGVVRTPDFMVVGTQGTVKGLLPDRLQACGVTVLLANAYHLAIRPGAEVVSALGGLHRMMAWSGPILTDSGGFQVFSLAPLAELSEEGVRFRSHLDGKPLFLGPEEALRVQTLLDSDILMAFDECLPYPVEHARAADSTGRTLRWAARSIAGHTGGGRLLFGIVQGAGFPDLREQCAARLVEMGFDGYAIGGVSVGEPTGEIRRIVDLVAQALPEDRPRYLMGVGRPADILASVAAGVDLFDCVLPTRNGRNGTAYTFGGKLNLRNASHAAAPGPIEDGCDCYACAHFSRGAIRHWFLAEELLAGVLASQHNVRFFMRLMERIRQSIAAHSFDEFARKFLSRYQGASKDASADPAPFAGA